ncbi:MAG: DUF4390 domain-containing protein [Nitrospirota bacterium]
MGDKKITGIILISILSLILLTDRVYAGDERISDLSVTYSKKDIYVSARLIRGFNKTSEENIKNGMQKDLFYYILLKKKEPFWFDEEILSKTIKYTIKYDILKKQYLIVKREDKNEERLIVNDYNKMKEVVTEIKDVKVGSLNILKYRHTYYVSVKAEMKVSRLPFYLDYFLFFVPFLEVDTDWADSSPFYSP